MKLLRLQFWKIRRALAPSARFKVALRRKLFARWDAEHFPRYAWYQTPWFRLSYAIMAGFVIVSSFTTGAYAYVSPEVAAGTRLYPVKQMIEKIEESLQTTTAAKAEFYLKKIRRREAESAALARRAQTTKITEHKIQQAEEQLEKINARLEQEPNHFKLRAQVRERLEQRQRRLIQKKLERLEPHQKIKFK